MGGRHVCAGCGLISPPWQWRKWGQGKAFSPVKIFTVCVCVCVRELPATETNLLVRHSARLFTFWEFLKMLSTGQEKKGFRKMQRNDQRAGTPTSGFFLIVMSLGVKSLQSLTLNAVKCRQMCAATDLKFTGDSWMWHLKLVVCKQWFILSYTSSCYVLCVRKEKNLNPLVRNVCFNS